jgi:hypothetical protein
MMKRLLFFAALIVAIGSIGGNTLSAHAQTASTVTATAMSSLTPAQIAALKQQLQVAQATLVNLEMQNGIAASADTGTSSAVPASIAGNDAQGATVATGLSATQISAFKTTLNTLAATLTQLDASVVSNSALTPSQETAVRVTLNGMQGTLVAMATDIVNGGGSPIANSAPVAVTRPTSAPVAVNNTPSTGTAPVTPASAPIAAQTPTATPTAKTSPSANNTVPQTAQASSIWSFTKAHWPTIVIVLLVIAILAILFWPEKEIVKTVSTGNSGSGKPKSAPTIAPATTINFSHDVALGSAKPIANSNVPAPATPVANAVAAPAQK